MPKRTPLRTMYDRERDAIAKAGEAIPGDAERAPVKPSSSAQTAERGRLAVHLPQAEFQAAKGAYLADWRAGGQADTFARWVANAGDDHARRTPAERAQFVRDTSPGGSKITRSFTVPADVLQRIRAAIAADQDEDRWLSESAWGREAIGAAVSAARAREGGVLPTPPPRLPNRLVRHG